MRILLGGSPEVRASDLLTAHSTLIDQEIQRAQCCGTVRCAAELKNLLLDVAQRFDDFYTERVGPARCSADACHC